MMGACLLPLSKNRSIRVRVFISVSKIYYYYYTRLQKVESRRDSTYT